MTSRLATAQHLRDLARLRRVRDRIARKYPQPLEVEALARVHDRSSTQGIKTVLHPVSDLATAKAVYAALPGVPPQTDGSYYVGFDAAGQHIGLVPGSGPQGMTSPVAYWYVPDLYPMSLIKPKR